MISQLESISNQIGIGIFKLVDGSIESVSGQIDAAKVKHLYTILKHTLKSTPNDPMKRIIIELENLNYVITTDGTFGYVVLIQN